MGLFRLLLEGNLPLRKSEVWLLPCCFVLLVLALAEPRWHGGQAPLTLVLLSPHDASGAQDNPPPPDEALPLTPTAWSQALREQAPPGTQILHRSYALYPGVAQEPSPDAAPPLFAALQQAREKIPAGRGRVLLLAPELSSDALPSLHTLRAVDGESLLPAIDAAPLPSPAQPAIEILGIRLPTSLRSEQRFFPVVEIYSRQPTAATVQIFVDGLLMAEKPALTAAGFQQVDFALPGGAAPLVRIEARLRLPEDAATPGHSVPFRDSAKAAAVVLGPPSVTLVGAGNASPRWDAWRKGVSSQGFTLREESWEEWLNASTVTSDICLLNGFPPTLSEARVEALWRWVSEEGGSLLVGGGPSAYGAAPGDVREALAALLPVEMAPQTREEAGRAALVVVLDRSGSMAQTVGGKTKMSLANEGTVRALETLTAGDAFGVLAVDVGPLVIWPLEVPKDRGAASIAARSVSVGGGGIAIYPALQAAWSQLRSSPAARRHILLFVDADDVEEKWEGQMSGRIGGRSALDLAAALLADGITTSVVALGRETDKDTAWLRELALRGRGRFHLTDDPRELPEIFALEAREARSLPPEFAPFFVRPSALGKRLFSSIDWDASPPLLACNRTRPRAGSDLLLFGPEETPLLVHKGLGVGRVMAFLSEIEGPWMQEWGRWTQWGDFWTQLLRLLTPERQDGFWQVDIQPASYGHPWSVRVQPADASAPLPPDLGPPALVARTLDGTRLTPLTPDWQPLAPACWQATFSPSTSPVLLTLAGPQPLSRQTEVRNPPLRAPVLSGTDAILPRWIAERGGLWQPTVAEVLRPVPGAAPRTWELRPWLLALAALTLGAWPLKVPRWLRR